MWRGPDISSLGFAMFLIPLFQFYGQRFHLWPNFVFQGHFQGHFGTINWPSKFTFLNFSFIVLTSVDTSYNISTIQNDMFDTNTCTYVTRASKIHWLKEECDSAMNMMFLDRSGCNIIVFAIFTISQWPTANSSSIALATALACNQALTME